MSYEFKHKENLITPILEAGRYRYKFSPQSPYEELKFEHDGQLGDWHFDQVMLNQGAFKQYEENTNTESMLGTAFSHIEKLQSFVTNEDGELTRSVEEGMDYTLRKYIDIIEGVDSETLDTAHGVYRTIQNYATKETSRFILDDSNFLVNLNKALTDEDGNIREQMGVIHATYDNLSLGLFGEEGMISGIGAVEEGVKIKGDIIRLEGTTVMDNAFIEELMAKEIFTTRLVALTGAFGDLIANNLDVNDLTGNKAQFLDALFQSKNSTLTINGDQVDITTQVWGQSRFIRLNYHGLELRKNTSKLGHLGSAEGLGSAPDSIFMGANVGTLLTLGYQGDNTVESNRYYSSIQIHGTTGAVQFFKNLNIGGQSILNGSGRGISIANSTNGFVLNGTNPSRIFFQNNGEILLSVNSTTDISTKTIRDALNNHASEIGRLWDRINSMV